MKELVKYELYKLFKQKSIYFVSLLLLIITMFFLLQMKGPSLYSLYKNWEGPITEQKLQIAQEEDKVIAEKQDKGLDITWEELKLRNVYNDVLKIGVYQGKQEIIKQQLNEKITKLSEKGDFGFNYRNLKLQKQMVQNINFQELYYQKPAAQMIDFISTYGLVFLGSLIIVGISPIFSQEWTTGVDQYMLSSKYGRKIIVHAKIVSSIIFVSIVLLISVAFNFIFWNVMEGNYGWNAELHSIQYFWDSPYSFNLWSYFLIKVAIQFISGCAFALFVLFVSAISKNTVVSFLISGFIFGFPIVVEGFIGFEMPLLFNILKFSYTELMLVDVLFKEFYTVNLFGYPVLYPIFAIIFLVITTVIIIYLLYKVVANKQAA